MRPLLAALLCVSALTAAAPALAQGYPPPGPPPGAPNGPPPGPGMPGHDLRDQLDGLQRRIDDGVRQGQLDRREYDRVQGALNSIRGQEGRMRMDHGGRLDGMDRDVLQQRIDELSRSIRWMRHDGPMPPPPPGPTPPPPPPPPGGPGSWSIDQREAWLQQSIDRGRADGSLGRREAFRAQRGLDNIRRAQGNLMVRDHGRLNDRDRIYLEQRLDQLRASLHWMREHPDAPPWARP